MTPDELIARYQGQYDAAMTACIAAKDLPYIKWSVVFREWSEAKTSLAAAKLMLAVCRSQGL